MTPRRVLALALLLALSPAAYAAAATSARGDAVCTVRPVTVWLFDRHVVTTPAVSVPCP